MLFCSSFFTWKYVQCLSILVLVALPPSLPTVGYSKEQLYSNFRNYSLLTDVSIYCCFSIFYNGVTTARGNCVLKATWQYFSLTMSRGGVYAHFTLGWTLPNCSSKRLLQPAQPPGESPLPRAPTNTEFYQSFYMFTF